jgi:hypothetical protein
LSILAYTELFSNDTKYDAELNSLIAESEKSAKRNVDALHRMHFHLRLIIGNGVSNAVLRDSDKCAPSVKSSLIEEEKPFLLD